MQNPTLLTPSVTSTQSKPPSFLDWSLQYPASTLAFSLSSPYNCHVVFLEQKVDNDIPLLRTLQWLPTPFRINPKVFTIVYKALQIVVSATSSTSFPLTIPPSSRSPATAIFLLFPENAKYLTKYFSLVPHPLVPMLRIFFSQISAYLIS